MQRVLVVVANYSRQKGREKEKEKEGEQRNVAMLWMIFFIPGAILAPVLQELPDPILFAIAASTL